jgi:hypothetical protein
MMTPSGHEEVRMKFMADIDVVPTKKVRVFSWTAVDPQLTRSLLATAFRAHGQLEQISKLDHLPDERLAEP